MSEAAVHTGGTGTPLVLLHGASSSWRAWRPVLPELERHHAVFAPTMSGHRGGPVWRADVPFSIDALVDAVCDQLDGAGIDTAHVVGNSLGGWVALELARRGRARTAVALSPAGAWRSPLDLQRLVWKFRMAKVFARPQWVQSLARYPQLRRIMLRRVLEHGERIPAHDVPGLFADLAQCAVLDQLLDAASADGAITPFRSLPCAIRVAWSERDRMIPWRRYGVPMRHAVPGAEFVRLPGVGHTPMYDDPELVTRTVLQVTAAGALASVDDAEVGGGVGGGLALAGA